MRQSAHELFQMSGKQFDHVYRQTLEPQLQKLEAQRKWTCFFQILIWIIGIPFTIIGTFRFATPFHADLGLMGLLPMAIMAATILGAGVLIANHLLIKHYSRSYKEVLIPHLFQHVGADLQYTAEPDVSKEKIAASGLWFNQHISSVNAEDGINGTIGSASLNVIEIEVMSGRGDNMQLIFDGIFCEAIFDEKFEGWLLVYPQSKIISNGTLWGELFAEMGSEKFESDARIRVDDRRFESRFRVYGSSPADVNTILTPKLMNNLITLHDRSEKIALTLRDRTVYVAVWTNDDYLEPEPWRPATDRKMLNRILAELGVMISIVEELNVHYY